MLLKDLIKTQLLKEEKFHSISQSMTFNYDIYHNSHSQYRKKRHGSGERITDYDIVKLLDKAKEEITYLIIDGKIRHKSRFIISDTRHPYLNLVIEPEKLGVNDLGVNDWNLVVITVMNKFDFTGSRNQLHIYI